MAYPVVETTATSREESTTSSHTITYPSSIADGDLLVSFVALGNGDGSSLDWATAGWTELIHLDQTGGASPSFGVGYVEADGTETGSFELGAGLTTRSAHITLRISGWGGTPDVSTGVLGSNDTTPDPDEVTASEGSGDNLFIATYGASHGSDAVATGYPTNYTGNNITYSNSTNQSTRVAVAVATRDYTNASDNPGTFTQADTLAETCACTVVIEPAAAAAAAILPPFRRRQLTTVRM